MERFLKTRIVLVAAAMSLCLYAYAEMSVITNVSSTAHSGGNTTQEGQIIESKAKATVDIKTTVNGVTVQEVHKASEGNGPIEINEMRTYENGSTTVKTSVSVTVNASSSPSVSSVKTLRTGVSTAGAATTTEKKGVLATSTSRFEVKKMTYFARLKQFFLNVFARITYK